MSPPSQHPQVKRWIEADATSHVVDAMWIDIDSHVADAIWIDIDIADITDFVELEPANDSDSALPERAKIAASAKR